MQPASVQLLTKYSNHNRIEARISKDDLVAKVATPLEVPASLVSREMSTKLERATCTVSQRTMVLSVKAIKPPRLKCSQLPRKRLPCVNFTHKVPSVDGD